MRVWGLCALALVFAAFYGANAVWAQDENSPIQSWPEQSVVITLPDYETRVSLRDLAHLYNICPETLYEANKSVFKYPDGFHRDLLFKAKIEFFYVEANTSIDIPAHEACYDSILFDGDEYNTILDLERTKNVCWEEFIDPLKATYNDDYTVRSWQVFVPRFAPPCYNDQNQRLTYYSDDGKPLLTPHYSPRQWIQFTGRLFEDTPYCRGDVVRVNPVLDPSLNSYLFYQYYIPGMTLFIDDSVRLCETVPLILTRMGAPWLDGVSFEENVCFDVLEEANIPGLMFYNRRNSDITVDIPYDHAPCYDQYRRRIGRHDQSAYRLDQWGWDKSLRGIAKEYNICLQDVLDANPHISIHSIVRDDPIFVVFLPDNMPCDTPQIYRTRGDETFRDVSILYDVCVNHIQDANPVIANAGFDDVLPPDLSLTIPNRPPCWMKAHIQGSNYGAFKYEMIPYACYRQPVDFNKDYTDTEPPLSLEPDATTDYCYDVGKKPILYENKFYEPIWSTNPSFNTGYEVAACYDIDFEAYAEFNELPAIKRIRTESSMFIPIPHETCDRDRWLALSARVGRLDNTGVYMVKFGDTVSSIGRQFGYEPSKIAIENNLETPYIIYPYQELQMPERAPDPRGHLDDKGVYVVAYGDTLASIARRFGYLPSMIAAENNLESPYWIYPYQELQMPRMPSLYDIGKSVLYAGGVGAGMIGFGLYRVRRRGKKKQKPAA